MTLRFVLWISVALQVLGGIFPGDSNVEELSNESFSTKVEHEPREVWIVVFYASWCPHCQQFGPDFIKAASEFVNQRDTLRFGALDCAVYSCGAYARSYPTLKVFTKTGPEDFPHTSYFGAPSVEDIIDTARDLLKKYMSHDAWQWHQPDAAPAASNDADGKKHVPSDDWSALSLQATRRTHFWDAHIAIIQSMSNSLFLKAGGGELPDDLWRKALEYVKFSVDHFPKELSTRPMRERLQTFYELLAAAKPKSEEEWRKTVKNNFSIVMQGSNYESCLTYTCAQWNLFHMLAQQIDDDDKNDQLKREFLSYLKNFATNFFGCEECSTHFQEILKEGEEKGSFMLYRASIWMWTAHNDATARIYHGDRSAWPPASICPKCWQKDGKADLARVSEFLQYDYESTNDDVWYGGLFLRYLGLVLVLLLIWLLYSYCGSTDSRFKVMNWTLRTARSVRNQSVMSVQDVLSPNSPRQKSKGEWTIVDVEAGD